MDLEQIRRLAAETSARCDELDAAIEQLRHDQRSLRAAVIYLNDALDGMDAAAKGGGKQK